MGKWRYSSTILYLDIGRRRMVIFTSRPLKPKGKSLRYPFIERLGGPQGWPGRYGQEKNFSSLQGIEPRWK
jgi:hypothetical protein